MRNDETPTPRPWKVYDRGIGWEIHSQDDIEINSEFRETFSKGNAELIVRAVNSHDALVAAVTRYLDLLSDCDYIEGEPAICPGIEQIGTPCHWCELRAALAKAVHP